MRRLFSVLAIALIGISAGAHAYVPDLAAKENSLHAPDRTSGGYANSERSIGVQGVCKSLSRLKNASRDTTSTSSFCVTAYELNQETQGYYAQQRFYQPQTGRFNRVDPVEGELLRPASYHRYIYGLANPTVYVDPTGEIPLLLGLALLGGEIGFITDFLSQEVEHGASLSNFDDFLVNDFDGTRSALSTGAGAISGLAGGGLAQIPGQVVRPLVAGGAAVAIDSGLDTGVQALTTNDPDFDPNVAYLESFVANSAFAGVSAAGGLGVDYIQSQLRRGSGAHPQATTLGSSSAPDPATIVESQSAPSVALSNSAGIIPGTTNVDGYIAGLPSKPTPSRTPADRFEIENAGPTNYQVSGGDEKFWIDGHRDSTILEAKFAGNPGRSPFVPGSAAPDFIRGGILDSVDDEFRRIKAILDDESNPFDNVEVITNHPESQKLFREMLSEHDLPPNAKVVD